MANLKQITRGIGKFRGGLANKTGKKLKISDFEVSAQVAKKQLIVRATIKSETPSKADPNAKNFEKTQKEIIKGLQAQLKDKNKSASDKKAIRLKINQRKKNIQTAKRTKEGAGNPAKSYKVTVIFGDVEFNDEKTDKFSQSVKAGGKLVYYKPPTRTAEVKMRCTCPDFRHNFSWPLAQGKSLAVPVPQKYFRVTPTIDGDPSNPKTYVRPPKPKNPNPHGHDFVNPQNAMGFCKHLFRFLQEIKANKVFKEV